MILLFYYFFVYFFFFHIEKPLSIILGAKVNQANANGETPLHKAVLNASNTVREAILEHLIANGADVNSITSRGLSPLHFAIEMRRDEVVKALLIGGADVNIADKNKNTPLSIATALNAKSTLRLIQNIQDVKQFLEGLALTQYFNSFAREEIFADVFSELNDSVLDTLGVKVVGHRIKILTACKQREKSTTSLLNSSLKN